MKARLGGNHRARWRGTRSRSRLSGTIALASDLPVIGKKLTIAGTGPPIVTVSGGNTTVINNGHQVFKITGGTVAISGLTIANGFSMNGGGAANFGVLTVTNSTVSGNSGDGGTGGIENLTSVTVTNSTIAGNRGTGGAGTSTHPPTIANSIVSNGGSTSSKNCGGTVVSKGYNLTDDATCATFFKQAGDRNSTAAGLDPHGLQSNFGTTPTIAVVAGSAALHAIPGANCVVNTDQRGVPRPREMGAFEKDVFNYTGFFAPVANLPNVNVVTVGQTGGVNFSLGGNFGLKVMAAGYPVMQPVNRATGASNGRAAAVMANLGYDSRVMSPAWKGFCGLLVVRSDGPEVIKRKEWMATDKHG